MAIQETEYYINNNKFGETNGDRRLKHSQHYSQLPPQKYSILWNPWAVTQVKKPLRLNPRNADTPNFLVNTQRRIEKYEETTTNIQ